MSTAPQSSPHSEPESIERLYVRLPTWVGDVVMATPTLDALRAALPQAQITFEGRGFMTGLLAGRGDHDAYITSPAKGAGATWRRGRGLAGLHFDAALLLADSVRSALPPWLARIPVRAGYARDPLRRALLTAHRPPPAGPDGRRIPVPMTGRYLELLPLLGLPVPDPAPPTRLVVDDAARQAVATRLYKVGVGAKPYVVASPGAAFGASKLYPPAQLAAALDGIAREAGLEVVLAPGPGEEHLCQQVLEAMETHATALVDPPTSLAELVSLVSAAELLVANDTGPRHVAVALGVPSVTLMGPTDRRHTDYQLEQQRVLREDVECSPCHKKICPIDHRCMTRLAPRRVIDAALEVLNEAAAGSPVRPEATMGP